MILGGGEEEKNWFWKGKTRERGTRATNQKTAGTFCSGNRATKERKRETRKITKGTGGKGEGKSPQGRRSEKANTIHDSVARGNNKREETEDGGEWAEAIGGKLVF